MSAKVPSIKGSAFQSVIEDLKQLVDEGRLEPDELDRSLTDKDRELFDALITPVGWFPVESYGRMLELLAREQGSDDPLAYLRERGARAAERLLSGAYQGFAAKPGTWGRRVGETMMSIGKLLYNFSEWTFHPVSDDVCEIRVSGARDYPEAARFTAEGFLQWFTERAAGRPMRVESSRPSPDRVIFHIEPS